MRRFKKRAGLLKNQDGVTALEFALIAPMLLLLLMGTIEVSIMMIVENLLESSTFAASRTGKTGYVADKETQIQTIRDALNQRAGSLLDVSKIIITEQSYSQFSAVGQPEPFIDANGNGKRDSGENFTDINGNGQYDSDQGTAGVGSGGDVVVYTVTYPWQVSTPMLYQFFGGTSTVNLSARAVVQNEPY